MKLKQVKDRCLYNFTESNPTQIYGKVVDVAGDMVCLDGFKNKIVSWQMLDSTVTVDFLILYDMINIMTIWVVTKVPSCYIIQ